jgi:hypothetical protein
MINGFLNTAHFWGYLGIELCNDDKYHVGGEKCE